jgi:hypothetical protein
MVCAFAARVKAAGSQSSITPFFKGHHLLVTMQALPIGKAVISWSAKHSFCACALAALIVLRTVLRWHLQPLFVLHEQWNDAGLGGVCKCTNLL